VLDVVSVLRAGCVILLSVGLAGRGDIVSFSLRFLFQVLLSDTADLQQSDSVSNYDTEVSGVVTSVDRASAAALLLLRT
jgi:hypothetical protein